MKKAVSAIVLFLLLLAGAWAEERPIGVYSHLLNPRLHPDDARRAVKPPTWDTFGNQPQFVCLRGFGQDGNRMIGYEEELEKYTRTHDLGQVIWPSYPLVFADNLSEVLDSISRRGLFLFDVWGYVPGSGPGDYWKQYTPSREALDLLENKLGDHWLGMDVGEQDGRYIGGYSEQLLPMSPKRFDQYLNFQRHFERMGDDLGNKLSTLVSLNFAHYFLREGTHSLIGAETAQALPNSQVYYAFIRGAGKQHGVPWFGNASVFNRWGYKTYGASGADHSPTKGSSLNLLKRLMYSHIAYNAMFSGFESSWFDGDALSPLGRIQQAAQQWVRANGQPGVQHTPIALMLDVHAGWSFPRHLYTEHVYRVWGNLPYEKGDYLTDSVLDMFYPGYQDASYYHDERGFLSPTPFGDMADTILSDAPGWVMDQYPVIILAGAVNADTELADKLTRYVNQGGHLVLTAANLAGFTQGLASLRAASSANEIAAPAAIAVGDAQVTEELPLLVRALAYPDNAEVLAYHKETPVAVALNVGKGRITALATDFGVSRDVSVNAPISNTPDAPLAKPYKMQAHVREILSRIIRQQQIFDTGTDLSTITCRKGAGEYTVYVSNAFLEPRPLRIESLAGPIASLSESGLDVSEKDAIGYLPEGLEQAPVGASGDNIIAGGDTRIFHVKIDEKRIGEIPRIEPPAAPRGRIIPLGCPSLIKEEILRRPTFFQHFDSVSVDVRYVRDRDTEALRRESGWLRRQGVNLYVDASSEINLYPGLRLVNNDPPRYEASRNELLGIMEKMMVLGAHDLIVCLHKQPENSFDATQTRNGFVETLRALAAQAAERKMTIHLAMTPKNYQGMDVMTKLVREVGASNLLLAPNVAMLIEQNRQPGTIDQDALPLIGLWLLSASARDINNRSWTCQATLSDSDIAAQTWRDWMALAGEKPIMLNATYDSPEAEYRDIRLQE